MSQNSIIRQWNGRTIRQRKDGYFSATDMCQACNKRFHNWERTDSAKEYLKALQDKRYSEANSKPLVDITQQNSPGFPLLEASGRFSPQSAGGGGMAGRRKYGAVQHPA